jgi:hypothetical protein
LHENATPRIFAFFNSPAIFLKLFYLHLLFKQSFLEIFKRYNRKNKF